MIQGQARGIWTYHSLKFEIWLYHEGPTLQSRITQKWLELSLSFFHIMKILEICGHFLDLHLFFRAVSPDELFPSTIEQSVPLEFFASGICTWKRFSQCQVHDLLLEKFLAHFLSSVVLLLQVTYK